MDTAVLKFFNQLQGTPSSFFWKMRNISSNFFFYLKVQAFQLIIENNFIQMAASAGHAVAHYRLCAAVFHQWLHECWPVKRQLSLACRRNTYLLRHPTNNSPMGSSRSSEVTKRNQLCG